MSISSEKSIKINIDDTLNIPVIKHDVDVNNTDALNVLNKSSSFFEGRAPEYTRKVILLDGIKGEPGLTGPQGEQGIQGEPGPQGIQGEPGQQNALGYTPEDVANKATSLTSPDNTKYPTTQAVADGLALKANITDVETILFKSSTTTVVTGKTLETSIYSIPLPNDGFNYIIEIYSQAQITTFAGLAITHRFRVGTYTSPIDGASGANSIGQQTAIAINAVGSAVQVPLTRRLNYKGGVSGSIYGISTASNIPDDANSIVSFTVLKSADLTTQHYLYVTFNPYNASAVISHSMITVKLIKI